MYLFAMIDSIISSSIWYAQKRLTSAVLTTSAEKLTILRIKPSSKPKHTNANDNNNATNKINKKKNNNKTKKKPTKTKVLCLPKHQIDPE